MTEIKPTTDCLETAAKVLLRCAGLGFGILFVWFGLYLLLPDLVRGQAAMFGLTEHEVGVATYCGLALLKISVLLLLSPIATDTLANCVLIGIGFVGVGVPLLWVGRRMKSSQERG